MLNRFFSNNFLKFSSLKQNIKQLPGNHQVFEENWIAEIRLHMDETEVFLSNISNMIENGFSDTEIHTVISMINKLEKYKKQTFNINVFFEDELIGFTLLVHKLNNNYFDFTFITEKDLATRIQEAADLFENPTESTTH